MDDIQQRNFGQEAWSPPPSPFFDLVMHPSKSMAQVLTICPVKDNESVMTFNPRNSYYAGGSKLPLHFSLNFRSLVSEMRI